MQKPSPHKWLPSSDLPCQKHGTHTERELNWHGRSGVAVEQVFLAADVNAQYRDHQDIRQERQRLGQVIERRLGIFGPLQLFGALDILVARCAYASSPKAAPAELVAPCVSIAVGVCCRAYIYCRAKADGKLHTSAVWPRAKHTKMGRHIDGRGSPSAPAGTRTAIRLGVILPRACRWLLAPVEKAREHCPGRSMLVLPNIMSACKLQSHKMERKTEEFRNSCVIASAPPLCHYRGDYPCIVHPTRQC